MDHMSTDISQPHVTATKSKSVSFMINPQQVQHRGVQVMNLKLSLDGLVPPLICTPVGSSALDPTVPAFLTSTGESFLREGISNDSYRTAEINRLSSTFPGTTAGPESPPDRMSAPLSR